MPAPSRITIRRLNSTRKIHTPMIFAVKPIPPWATWNAPARITPRRWNSKRKGNKQPPLRFVERKPHHNTCTPSARAAAMSLRSSVASGRTRRAAISRQAASYTVRRCASASVRVASKAAEFGLQLSMVRRKSLILLCHEDANLLTRQASPTAFRRSRLRKRACVFKRAHRLLNFHDTVELASSLPATSFRPAWRRASWRRQAGPCARYWRSRAIWRRGPPGPSGPRSAPPGRAPGQALGTPSGAFHRGG